MNDKVKEIVRIVVTILTAIITALTTIFLQSCTASRIITTSSSYIQHGDTTTTITTKTTETYNGSKNL